MEGSRSRRRTWVLETLEQREVMSSGLVMGGFAPVQAASTQLVGRLAATSDDGASNHDGITSQRRLVFEGTSTPGASINLTGQKLLKGKTFTLGRTVANAQGQWTLSTGALGLGKYTVRASASGQSATLYGMGHPIVIVR